MIELSISRTKLQNIFEKENGEIFFSANFTVDENRIEPNDKVN